MMENTKVFAELEEIIDAGFPYWERHRPNEASLAYKDTKEKVQTESLVIQLYGAYNAGKSTLINVLFAEDVAQTGEIPTTDKIELYDWNGIKVIDTPGTNAPIEHENVTAQELKKNDLVIFVLRTGEYDVRDIYKRLVEILESAKEVFIVLNYESMDDNDEQDPWAFASYIEDQLIRVAEEADAKLALRSIKSGNINVVPVNLASASRGLQNGKEKLADNSGVNLLFSYLNEWIRDFDNQSHRVEKCKEFVQMYYLNPLLEMVENEGIAQEIKEQQEVINHLVRIRDNTLQKADNKAFEIGMKIKSELPPIFEGSTEQEDFENKVSQCLNAAANSFQDWLSSELQNEIVLSLREFTEVELDPNIEDHQSSSGSPVNEHVRDGFKRISSHPRLLDEHLPNGIGMAVEYLNNFEKFKDGNLVNFLDKISKVLQKAGPALTVLISVGSSIWDSKKEGENNKKERERALQKRQAIDSIVDEFKKAAREQAEGLIVPAFEESIQSKKAEVQRIESELKSKEKDYTEIMALSRKTGSIMVH